MGCSLNCYRVRVGLFLAYRSQTKLNIDKWKLLSLSLKNFLNMILLTFFIILYFSVALQKNLVHFSKYFCKPILLLTNIYYYYKSCQYLFICQDISLNPGPDGLFRFCHWNLNSIVTDSFSRVNSLQAYMVQNNIHLTAITESATKKETVNEKLEIPGYTVIRNDLVEGDSHGGC